MASNNTLLKIGQINLQISAAVELPAIAEEMRLDVVLV